MSRGLPSSVYRLARRLRYTGDVESTRRALLHLAERAERQGEPVAAAALRRCEPTVDAILAVHHQHWGLVKHFTSSVPEKPPAFSDSEGKEAP